MSHLAVSKQSAPLLFNCPIEIRRAIYAQIIDTSGIHIVRTEQGNLRLCACVGPDLYAGHTGSERRTTDDRSDDPAWARRLISSWGPHWECEELLLRADEDGENEEIHTQAKRQNNGAILRVCRTMLVSFPRFHTP